MFWFAEALVSDHTARLRAEAEHQRQVRAALASRRSTPGEPPRARPWWRRLMGVAIVAPRHTVVPTQ